MRRYGRIAVLVVLAIAVSSVFAFSKEATGEKQKLINRTVTPKAVVKVKKEELIKHTVTPKEVIGRVTGISDNMFITVLYYEDKENGADRAMLFVVDKDTKFDHVKDITGLNLGDIVRAQYEETNDEFDSGKTNTNRKTTVISLQKRGTPRTITPEPEPSEGSFKSSGPDAE